jgi:hypothetical protein
MAGVLVGDVGVRVIRKGDDVVWWVDQRLNINVPQTCFRMLGSMKE